MEILSVHAAVLIHAKTLGLVTTGTCVELNEHDFWACSRKSVDKIEVRIWAIMAFSPMTSLIQYRMKNQAANEIQKTWPELGYPIAKQCLSNSDSGCLSPTCGHVCDARILANSGHGWGQCTHPLLHCAQFCLCPRLGPQICHRIRSCWDSSHCARYDLIQPVPVAGLHVAKRLQKWDAPWLVDSKGFQTRNTHDHLAGHGLTACSESKTH